MRLSEHIITEAEARSIPVCIGCGRPTDCPGGMVCWGCFKGGDDPLKYSWKSFAHWQAHLPPLPAADMDCILRALGRLPSETPPRGGTQYLLPILKPHNPQG